jgi:hypothetical protein
MRKLLELVICVFHPVAVILIWAGMFVRDDIGIVAKITWAVVAIIPLVPFIYVLTGNELFPRDD